MSLVVPWLALPLLFAATALGTGLLVERAGGHRIPIALLFGLGFAGVVCVSQIAVRLVPQATPFAVLAVALAGLAVGRRRLRMSTLDLSASVMALVVFGLYAAPVVFTGEATFLGYGNNGDAGFHFALVDALIRHGHDLGDLPYSSFSATVQSYYDTAYPTGAHTVLGSLRAFTGTDVAWLFQPYLTCLVVTAALGLHALMTERGPGRWPAAAAAGLACSGGLVYAYANNQQALKELAALVCIVTAAGLVRPLVAAPPTWRSGVPAAVLVAGGLGVLSLALAPWLGPLTAAAAVGIFLRHRRWGALAVTAPVFLVVAVVLALPTLTGLRTFTHVTSSALTGAAEMGNLLAPLHFLQAFGVWPAGDFRLDLPDGSLLPQLLIAAVVLAAAAGLALAVRDRRTGLLLFAAASAVGFLAVAGQASPWAYGKALMLLSPAAVLLAAALAVSLAERGRRAPAAAVLAVIAAGVLWTDARTYHSASPAPRARLAELTRIDARFSGRGPLGYFEYEEFAKHFLRHVAPSGQSEAFRLPGPAYAPGKGLRFGYSTDPDDFVPASLADTFRLLLLRRGPLTSRPAAGWKRVYRGRYYDVFRRDPHAPRVGAHVPLGGTFDAAADAPCDDVRRLAAAGARIAYAPRPRVRTFRVDRARRPTGWSELPGSPEDLVQAGPGVLTGSVDLPGGRYGVWLAGSVQRPVSVTVDGTRVGSVGSALAQRPSQLRVGTVESSGGTHEVSVAVGGGSLAPGNGGINRVVGPVLLTTADDPGAGPVRTVPASRWRTVCGRHADWVEALR